MVGPVAAASANAVITGNPEDYISIAETGDTTGWVFTRDTVNVNQTCYLSVTSNHIGWTVGVQDANASQIVAAQGHMMEYTTEYGSKYLRNAMIMNGAAVAGQYYNDGPRTLTIARQIIWRGESTPTGVGTFTPIPITIRQQVDNEDEHLISGVYRIVVEFTTGLP